MYKFNDYFLDIWILICYSGSIEYEAVLENEPLNQQDMQ